LEPAKEACRDQRGLPLIEAVAQDFHSACVRCEGARASQRW
jgi:hypothetical protein